jgi:RNA polymerase sigma-70 factor (ECF subfamily)
MNSLENQPSSQMASQGAGVPGFHAAAGPGSFGVVSDQSFEALMAQHHGEIYRYVLRVTGRRTDADDLSQETFLRAFRAHRALPPDANARAWLFAIATNLCRNHFRSQKRRRTAYAAVGLGSRDMDHERPDGVSASKELGAAVDAVVSRLPLKQRLAFLQRKVHGLDYEAIGQTLECSGESARAHVFQALRKVRRALESHGLIGKELAS